MRKHRADLNAHVPIPAIGLFVKRHEGIAGGFDIFNRKLPEDLFRIPAGPGKRYERGIIICRFGDRVVEDGWVGGHATNVAAFDHRFKFAVLQQFALDIIHPEGLAELCKFFNCV